MFKTKMKRSDKSTAMIKIENCNSTCLPMMKFSDKSTAFINEKGVLQTNHFEFHGPFVNMQSATAMAIEFANKCLADGIAKALAAQRGHE